MDIQCDGIFRCAGRRFESFQEPKITSLNLTLLAGNLLSRKSGVNRSLLHKKIDLFSRIMQDFNGIPASVFGSGAKMSFFSWLYRKRRVMLDIWQRFASGCGTFVLLLFAASAADYAFSQQGYWYGLFLSHVGISFVLLTLAYNSFQSSIGVLDSMNGVRRVTLVTSCLRWRRMESSSRLV